jgi:2Fe-2S ferredoxin
LPEIHFSSPSGEQFVVEVPVGWSLMEGATQNDVPGLLADCGGACSCATCHVYIDPDWLEKLPPKAEVEKDMLSCVDDQRSNSRLSCQIRVSELLDGLKVAIADNGV